MKTCDLTATKCHGNCGHKAVSKTPETWLELPLVCSGGPRDRKGVGVARRAIDLIRLCGLKTV